MTKGERIILIVVIAVLILLVSWITWANIEARIVKLACEAAGYDSFQSVFFSRTDYCTKVIVPRQMVTVPLSQAMEGESDCAR